MDANSDGMPDSGYADGPPAAARFRLPVAVAVDATGGVFVADSGNYLVRHVSPDGMTSTLAGTSGASGELDGTAATARFSSVDSIALGPAGTVYIGERENSRIRILSADGVVTTLAGPVGSRGGKDGVFETATFRGPGGMAMDNQRNLYVADGANHTIRRVSVSGRVTTLAGAPMVRGAEDGPGASARFYFPGGVAADASRNVYVADTGNHTIRAITPSGMVSTLAGSPGQPGAADGVGVAARFNAPEGVAVDQVGRIYVADTLNHTIRRIEGNGAVSTLAGNPGEPGMADGQGNAARFHSPRGIAVDRGGDLYVADYENHVIRKVTATGAVTTIAGAPGVYVPVGADGLPGNARFWYPRGITADQAGNVYVADRNGRVIRRISQDGTVCTLAGLPGSAGTADGIGTDARFVVPYGIAVDPDGNLYVSDNNTVRKGWPAPVEPLSRLSVRVGRMPGGKIRLTVQRSDGTAPSNLRRLDLEYVREPADFGPASWELFDEGFIITNSAAEFDFRPDPGNVSRVFRAVEH